jgi:RNA polymerase sigma factor (sigma-70 family)
MIEGTEETLLRDLCRPEIDKPVRQLYDFYFEGIVALVCSHGGNRADGADIFQEAVLILIEKVRTARLRGESNIKTFLHAIAYKLWLFEQRTRGRRKKREALFSNSEVQEMAKEIGFISKRSRTDLLAILGQIGDTCKKILTGFYYEEKSMKELLVLFNYENEQVLRNKKSKCMKKLKELIARDTDLLEHLKTLPLYE